MRSLFDDAAFVDDEDSVGVFHRRKAMRDDQNRAVFHQVVNRLLDDGFGLVVQGGRRFVQDDDRRVFHERAGNRDTLFLSARQQNAALSDLRIQPFIQSGDKVRQTRVLNRFVQLFVGVIRLAQQNVVADCPVEQEVVLEHNGDILAQIVQVDVFHIHAVNQNLALLNVVKARQQADKRRLSAARIAHKSIHLADFQLG